MRRCDGCGGELVTTDAAVRFCRTCVDRFLRMRPTHTVFCRDLCECWTGRPEHVARVEDWNADPSPAYLRALEGP